MNKSLRGLERGLCFGLLGFEPGFCFARANSKVTTSGPGGCTVTTGGMEILMEMRNAKWLARVASSRISQETRKNGTRGVTRGVIWAFGMAPRGSVIYAALRFCGVWFVLVVMCWVGGLWCIGHWPKANKGGCFQHLFPFQVSTAD